MIFMGFGSASVFTTTSIAGQNAVEYQDMGVTTATLMFFRSFGGSVGLAIFGTLLNGTIRSEIPRALPQVSPDDVGSLIRSPKEIAALEPVARQAVIDSVASGVGRIYFWCGVVMAIGIAVAFWLPEWPLRARAGLSDAMEKPVATE
jgi:hypothetical protein